MLVEGNCEGRGPPSANDTKPFPLPCLLFVLRHTGHIMVRIKHRYLLVNILYPEPENKSWTGHTESRKPLPHLVQFRRPSPDDLSPQLLARSIKDQIALLYGDYGVGLTSGGLNGIKQKIMRLITC